MSSIFISSTLSAAEREALEELMFFNPLQPDYEEGIIESIERYGIPRVTVDGERLRVTVQNLPEVQTLFAFDGNENTPRLAGVLVYVRTDQESIVVLHIGVKEDYSISGIHADEMLAMKLLARLRSIASRIKGVRSLTVIYGKGVIRKIPVCCTHDE